jgi:hypothetical protein
MINEMHMHAIQVKDVADKLTSKWKAQVSESSKTPTQTPANKKSDDQKKNKSHTPSSDNGMCFLMSCVYVLTIRALVHDECMRFGFQA